MTPLEAEIDKTAHMIVLLRNSLLRLATERDQTLRDVFRLVDAGEDVDLAYAGLRDVDGRIVAALRTLAQTHDTYKEVVWALGTAPPGT